MGSSRRKKRRQDSVQVESWHFTYQDRIHCFGGIDQDAGESALSAYAALYGTLERKLFARHCAGIPIPSLKRSYLARYSIPARMFNSLSVLVRGKAVAVHEGQLRRVDSLERRIRRAEEQINRVLDSGNRNGVHQKKRRLAALKRQPEGL